MKLASFTLALLAAASALPCQASDACALQNLNISRAVAEKVSIFTPAGKFQRAANSREVLPAKVVACNKLLGLVQVVRADGSRVWIDPIEVRLPTPPAKSPLSTQVA